MCAGRGAKEKAYFFLIVEGELSDYLDIIRKKLKIEDKKEIFLKIFHFVCWGEESKQKGSIFPEWKGHFEDYLIDYYNKITHKSEKHFKNNHFELYEMQMRGVKGKKQ